MQKVLAALFSSFTGQYVLVHIQGDIVTRLLILDITKLPVVLVITVRTG